MSHQLRGDGEQLPLASMANRTKDFKLAYLWCCIACTQMFQTPKQIAENKEISPWTTEISSSAILYFACRLLQIYIYKIYSQTGSLYLCLQVEMAVVRFSLKFCSLKEDKLTIYLEQLTIYLRPTVCSG